MMKNKWLRALWLLPFLGLSACGGGGGGSDVQTAVPLPSPPNTAPTANFAFSCIDLGCSFKSTSSDSDVGDSISAYNWNFGDGSGPVTTRDAQHTYAAGTTYPVTLTVRDNRGATGTVVKNITVFDPVAPPPLAGSDVMSDFSVSCVSLDCTFTDKSTPTSNVQTWLWDFGDGGTSTLPNPPVHRYNVKTLTEFTVTLTVTSATNSVSVSSKSLPVAPPASTLNCVGGQVCDLTLTQAATVTVTLVSSSCAATGNRFVITQPVTETLFTDGCTQPLGPFPPLNGGAVFAAGTQIEAEVRSGLTGTTGLEFPPALRVSGDFSNGWTLEYDDGAGGPGEPDFNDLVILIKAAP